MAAPLLIVAYALAAAAAAAAATTAVKASTGGVEDLNDAAGEFLKTFFISFAANSVGGAAGAAGEAGSTAGGGMSASETAAANAAGNSAQLAGNVGVGAGEVAGEAAMTAQETAMLNAEMAAQEGIEGAGSFASQPDVGLGAANTTGMDMSSGVFDQTGNWLNNLNVKKNLFSMMGGTDKQYGMMNSGSDYTDIANEAISFSDNNFGPGDSQQTKDIRKQALDQQAFGLVRGSLSNEFAQEGKQLGFEEWLKTQDPFLARQYGLEDLFEEQDFGSSLGGF